MSWKVQQNNFLMSCQDKFASKCEQSKKWPLQCNQVEIGRLLSRLLFGTRYHNIMCNNIFYSIFYPWKDKDRKREGTVPPPDLFPWSQTPGWCWICVQRHPATKDTQQSKFSTPFKLEAQLCVHTVSKANSTYPNDIWVMQFLQQLDLSKSSPINPCW